ncbi:putative MFS family arabinose efflux permease [Nocardiopsis arvandica]|uniref:Putative MFS family arabinose efflux permease n=1 Tax=Nocardiopsis sinuspersici TaxID=501010 RepID=A0A7Z0BIY6_9ACTN|nr:MFS transporter [Nocardiopsis sinuspersici]NYH51510.1 putative MFS family arabinose efflux permease [Nocardiopsis sinuspersici]
MAEDTASARKPAHTPFHRAWLVALVACLTIVAAAAFAAMPGLLTEPLHTEYAWSRGSIGAAASVNMVVYGLIAPFAAALMDRFGIRRVALVALATIVAGAGLTTVMTAAWQLTLYWGLLIGAGTGSLAMTFAATVTDNWFVERRGLVIGTLTGASAFGQLVFLPALAWIVDHQGWRPAIATLALTAGVMTVLTALVLRDHPADLGRRPYGATAFVEKPEADQGAARRTLRVLYSSVTSRGFWLLGGTFAVCGATTNGILWTHFVPAAQDQGMAVTVAAALVSTVGVFSLVGTVLSGWLTDRVDPRALLVVYYAGRGVLLALLPALLGPEAGAAMTAFVVVFGLLDVATVPPTIMLCHRAFGADGAIVFGWVNAVHQVGAGTMAVFGGLTRDVTGGYGPVWLLAAALCGAAALLALRIGRGGGNGAEESEEDREDEGARV